MFSSTFDYTDNAQRIHKAGCRKIDRNGYRRGFGYNNVVYQHLSPYSYILAVFSLVVGIFISNLIKMKGASAICALVIMLILIVPLDTKPYLYAIKRTLETTIGIVVAVLINFSFKRKSKLEPYLKDQVQERPSQHLDI